MVKKTVQAIMLSLLLLCVMVWALHDEYANPSDREFRAGGTAYDWLGMKLWGGHWTELDPLHVLKKNGLNWNRIGVLIKNCPVGDSECWCSIEYAEEVMKSSVKNGMRIDLFFYLSHTAAYAAHQPCPPEWEHFTVEEKANALRRYCNDTVTYYKSRGLNIETYEMGNEIDFGILGEEPPKGVDWWDIDYLKENIWNKEAQMLKGAIKGVKKADPQATILLHIGCSSRPYFVRAFFKSMIEFEVPFDLAGLSFYPSYAGEERPDIETLKESVEEIAGLGKKTFICEYSYPSSPSSEDPTFDKPVTGYPLTPKGQAKHLTYFLKWCSENPHTVGVMYFYPDNCLSETDPTLHPGPHTALFFNDTTVKPALKKFKLLIRKPKSPRNLRAKVKSWDQIRLKWRDKSTNEDGIEIERAKGKLGEWTRVTTTKANVNTYMDRGLEANTLYQYRIRAFNVKGKSSYSNTAKAKTSSKLGVSPLSFVRN